jgi:heme exporter protein A
MDFVAAEKVGKSFGRQRVLSQVSFRLDPGQLCVLLGPNGAGKSTLIGVLSTLVHPSAGAVRYGAGSPSGSAVRAAIGLLAHEAFVYGELDAVENISFYAELYGVPDPVGRATALLDQVGLEPAARTRQVRTYSRGMLQRVALARALVNDPRFVLLDEPFTGLDRSGTEALVTVLARLKAEGRILIVATHDLEAVSSLADHLIVLRAGRVALDEQQAEPLGLARLRDAYRAVTG